MDRSIWKKDLSEKSAWPWPCPACRRGRLRMQKDRLVMHETTASRNYRANKEDSGWEPDLYVERFSVLLLCESCSEPVFVCGTTADEPEYGPEGEEWNRHLVPVFFHPALHIIAIPPACPEPVREEIQRAFSSYWCDLLSCANRIRNAIELLLTHFKIPAFRIDSTRHERRRVTLHQRINLFSDRRPIGKELATAMFAVKWIGNEGSHPGKLTQDDLLDAFELLEHVLSVLFVPPEQSKVVELAKAIHKRKKPRSHHVQRRTKRTPIASVPSAAPTT